ncbi:STAS domain-containing protein [Nitrosococcus wardiae]|uniref:Anti-sigma factor antagonist n=1 Tax=Nitrosococcus wardiae TaxID=1814290 RepID=A0A4P7C1L6_9GAMM|nr:STAS domain-containing protein [Nitrosococcus wardiae]QBQ55510.1 anti-sigma factor antagonist [Nitrosococcus wardiae]
MAEGKILHATYDGVHVLRFLGDVRYPLSPSLDHFLQNLFAEVTPQGFVIDLTETRSIDSTNLGLLVRIAKFMQRFGRPRVTIISNRKEINEVLTCLGFDKVFNIVEHGDIEPPEGEALAVEEVDSAAMSDTLLKAHRTLMSLNEQNKEQFRDVVAILEQEQADKSSASQ